jgi:phosphohistidine phosphatase
MNLYLMRHANAGVPRDSELLDAKRSLVKEGKEQCMLMGRLMNALNIQVDVVIASPMKRSTQTAQFVATELGFEGRVEVEEALGPDASYEDFRAMLEKYQDRDEVLAVGHNPNLFRFLGHLITGNGPAAIRMRKASVARVDLEHHPPLLRWLIDPRMARAIYASLPKNSKRK